MQDLGRQLDTGTKRDVSQARRKGKRSNTCPWNYGRPRERDSNMSKPSENTASSKSIRKGARGA